MKKLKNLIVLLIVCFYTNNLHSNPVDTIIAKQIAINWYLHYNTSKTTSYNISNRYSIKYNNNICIYIFSFNNNSNIIVAGDDAALPVLGFSFDKSFDSAQFKENENFYYWLEEYCMQIDSNRILNIGNDSTIGLWNNILNNNFNDESDEKDNNPYVAPLIQTQWGQDLTKDTTCPGFSANCVYSFHCPCENCSTGCVATAMAQVMNYWQKPYYFDWCNMPGKYLRSSDINYLSEVNAVATLMKNCGVNVGTSYCADGCQSSADPSNISNTLTGYLYNSDFKFRSNHRDEVWKGYIVNDLTNGGTYINGRPIIYSGGNTDKAHTFILDGCKLWSSTDYYHFNWGWNGQDDDEWCLLSSLNTDNGNFTDKQNAVFGIEPNYWCDDNINIGDIVDYSAITSPPPPPFSVPPVPFITWTGVLFSYIDDGTPYQTPSGDWRISYPNIAAGTINVNNATIPNQADITFIGHEQIVMENFTAEEGSNFVAEIIPCNCMLSSTPSSKLISGNSQNSSNYQTSNDTIKNINNLLKNNSKNNQQVNFSISPNPNNGNMNVSYEIPTASILEIYNSLGIKLYSFPLYEGKNTFTINETNLNSGIYYYRATANNKIFAKDKIVVIK